MLQVINKRVLLYVLLTIGLAIVLGMLGVFDSNTQYSQEQLIDYPHQRQLSYEFRIQNKTPRPSKKAEVRAYISASHASTQLTTNITHKGRSLITDSVGNKLVLFSLDEMAAGESTMLNVGMNLASRDEPKKTSGSMNDQHFQNEINSGEISDELKAVMEQLKGSSPETSVTNILMWMKENVSSTKDENNAPNINVPPLSEERDVDLLKMRDDSPVGRVYLFVALCKVMGIPARGVVGVVENNSEHNDEITTVTIWPEFNDGDVWRAADILNYKITGSISDFIALRTIKDMDYRIGQTAESFLFETVSVSIVPGSVKLRIKKLPLQ